MGDAGLESDVIVLQGVVLLGLVVLVEKARWLVQPRESFASRPGVMLVLEISSYAEEHHGEYDEGVDSKDQAWR